MVPGSLLHWKLWFASASTAAIEAAISCYRTGTSTRAQAVSKYSDWPQKQTCPVKCTQTLLTRTHTHTHFLFLLFIIYTLCFCSDITAWNFDLCSLKPSAKLTSSHLPSSCLFSLPLSLFSLSSSSPYLPTSHHPESLTPTPCILPSPTVCRCRSLISASCSPSPSLPKPSSSALGLFHFFFLYSFRSLLLCLPAPLIIPFYPLNPYFSLSHTPSAGYFQHYSTIHIWMGFISKCFYI